MPASVHGCHGAPSYPLQGGRIPGHSPRTVKVTRLEHVVDKDEKLPMFLGAGQGVAHMGGGNCRVASPLAERGRRGRSAAGPGEPVVPWAFADTEATDVWDGRPLPVRARSRRGTH